LAGKKTIHERFHDWQKPQQMVKTSISSKNLNKWWGEMAGGRVRIHTASA
jgi:hypothetical protein